MRRRHSFRAAALLVGLVCGACAKASPTSSLITPTRPEATASTATQDVSLPDPGRLDASTRAIQPEVLAAAGFIEQRNEVAGIDQVLDVADEAPDAGATVRDTVIADLIVTGHDVDIPLNDKVLSFVELFSGRLKSFLEEGLSRGVPYLPMIQSIFRAEGLPLDLAFVPLVESAFKVTAVSRAQARGMWQFMSRTALENGLQHDWYVDERAEPEKSTRAAARYLKTLSDMFDGDWHLALASYNGGPGRVQRAIRRAGGDADFWKLSSSSRYLPRETRDYVPLILAAIIIARNPTQYGIQVEPMVAPASEVVTLPVAMDLRRIAEWVGTPIDAIQQLNPELRRWTTPVRSTAYDLKVPMGTADILRAQLAAAVPEDLTPVTWHAVRSGETLASVAKKLGVARTDLAQANYLTTKARLQVGQRLIVPKAPALLLASPGITPIPSAEPVLATAAVVADAPVAASQRPAPATPRATSVVYRVKRGDTLFSIARIYQTTVAALKALNNLRSDTIKIGQRLTILRGRAVTSTN